MDIKTLAKKIRSRKFEVIFFLLVFLIFFRFDAVPLQTDEWGYAVAAKYVTSDPFSPQTLETLNEYQLLTRPICLVIFIPFYLVFGTNYLTAMPFFHLLLSLLTLLLVYFNFRLFEKLFGRSVAFLSSFLLSASFFVVYTFWYTASVNINIATLCIVAAAFFFTKIEERNSKYFAAFFMVVGMLTRETVAIAFILMIAALFITNKKARSKTTIAVLALPFVLFAAVLFLLTGFVLQPLQSGMISKSPDLVANLGVYFGYWFGYYLLTQIIGFSILLFLVGTAFAARKGISRAIKKIVPRHWFSLSPKQSAILVLAAAFAGGLVPLAVATQSSPRYVVPVLPIIFGFAAKFFSDAVLDKLTEKAKNFFLFFLLSNLAFWVLFFNSKNLLWIFGSGSIGAMVIALNLLFFAIVLSVPAFVLYDFFRTKKAKRTGFPVLAAFAIMSFLIAFSSVVQINELNVFYVTHYHNSSVAFQANKFIAETVPGGATVYSQQDLSWIYFMSLEAFGRKDINLVLRAPELPELKKGDFVVYNSRVGSQTWQTIQGDRNSFELLVSFGGQYKKYPRSSLEKSGLFSEGLLFRLFLDRAETMDIYRFKG